MNISPCKRAAGISISWQFGIMYNTYLLIRIADGPDGHGLGVGEHRRGDSEYRRGQSGQRCALHSPPGFLPVIVAYVCAGS